MTTDAGTPIVGFVAPSGFVRDSEDLDAAARSFVQRGWRVEAGDSCFAREQRFAGPDELRGSELQRFCSDPRIDLVLAARGGYGLSRLLDRIDFAAIRRRNPIICGYSDFTAFSLAYLARASGVSLQGPSAVAFGAAQPEPFTVEQFFAVISSPSHALAFDTPAHAADAALEVSGTLWGGNLALVCALLGTRYFPQVDGGILFVEDVNEPAYSVERMLLHLFHAGVLQRQRALLLGEFNPMPPQPTDNGFDLESILAALRARLDIPIVTGLPFGHVARKATLPVGAPAQLVVRGGRAQLSFSGHPHLAAD